MYKSAWSFLVYLYGLVVQIIWNCEEPLKISAGSLNRIEYFGTWYFIAAAGKEESHLHTFKHVDNIIFDLQGAESPERLVLRGALQVSGHGCIDKKWIYFIHRHQDGLDLQGRPERKTFLYQSDTKNSIILQEIEETGDHPFNRIMLYARSRNLTSDHVQDFQEKASCMGLKVFLLMPQEEEYCIIKELD
ncbi:apolipoprotein M [Erpetoichthys calabaricus]|uniref:Apolipoprotein M n=1 Tax=Erpetoichthys calabaricus TaxID=27687 RepID=A0A8C4X2T0_ERPCA|nr:apolipoprotein M [Erpetoichthys calabaricus]